VWAERASDGGANPINLVRGVGEAGQTAHWSIRRRRPTEAAIAADGASFMLDAVQSRDSRGGHPIFFSWFAIDGSITFSLLFDFDKSKFLEICRFANSINRCFWQVTKNRSLSRFANR
jgi:hypothetical protein